MITGTLIFDVEVTCDSETATDELSSKIEKLIKGCDNQVMSCEEIDRNLQDDSQDAE